MGDDDKYTVDLSDITIGDITLDATADYDDWLQQYVDNLDVSEDWYSDNRLGANDINLTAGGEEMLRVAEDGFYVRGVRVEADAKEAKAVYEAFKQWMTYAILNGEINSR